MKKRMRIFVKSFLCGLLPFSLLLSGLSVSAYTGNSTKALTSGADIRVMSYNTLVDNDEANGGWSWGKPLGNRAEKAAAAITYYQPDVIGLQENNYNWHVALRELLPDYDYVNADVPQQQKLEKTESLGKKDWMCTTMMYNTKTLELVENELIGYSVNYWGCIQRMRYISMAVFKVKATGEKFVFTSTHFDAESDSKGQKMRKKQATELADRLVHYKNTYGCPIISTGDYNSGYSAEPLTIVRDTAAMDSYKDNRGGIDYILYSQGVSCKYFTVVNDADLSGASDHHPIFADLSLQDHFSFPTTKPTTTTTAKPTTTATKSSATTTQTTQKTQPTTTRPTAYVPTKNTQSQPVGTTAPTVADPIATGGVIDPTQGTDTPTVDTPTTGIEVADPTDAPVADAPTDTETSEPTSVSTTPVAEDEDTKVEAEIVKKGNDKLLYIGIAAAVVAIGVFIAVAYSVKKK